VAVEKLFLAKLGFTDVECCRFLKKKQARRCVYMASELERGRSEAAHTTLRTANVTPYLSPPSDTAYPLRYAFYLMGDVIGKTVLDLGCGSGENLVPLLARGAHVIAIDLSPELIELARKRVELSRYEQPLLIVGSATKIPIPDTYVDAVLCSSLLHHLNIPQAMAEIRRVLKRGGYVVIKEPVRFSRLAGRLRKLFPLQKDTSDDEHPLTRKEVEDMKNGWHVVGERAFRLPFVPMFGREQAIRGVWGLDRLLLKKFNALEHYSTSRVLKLTRPD
jgi:SAM-dependent methyltransferase